MMPRSLLVQLSLQQQVFALVLIVAFASLAIGISTQTQRRQEKRYLAATAEQIARSLDHEWAEEGSLAAAATTTLASVPSDIWVDVYDGGGTLVASTAHGGRRPTFTGADTRRVPLGHGAFAAVSVSNRAVRGATTALVWALAITSIPLLAASIVASRALARRTLAPLTRLASEADRAATQSHPRMTAAATDPLEIVTLSTAFDRLLERIHAMIAAERSFTQDAAHELRTPLTVLSGEIEMALADAALPERRRYGLARAAEQVRDMSDLVEALLLLRRADFNLVDSSARLERVDLGSVAQTVASEMTERSPARAADIRVDAPAIAVQGDAILLAAAIRNLVGNAVKFTEPGQPVRVAVTEAEGIASVVVEDGGPGIPEADRARAFDPFHRGGEARATHEGVGLGLPISLRVARAHGGDVDVSESALGGARFRFRLPTSSNGTKAHARSIPSVVAAAEDHHL